MSKLMTVNQIHKKYIGKHTALPHWLTVEKIHFNSVKPEDMDFDTWINEKYRINGSLAWLNADAEGNPTNEVNDKNKTFLEKLKNGDKTFLDKLLQLGYITADVYEKYVKPVDTTKAEQEESVKQNNIPKTQSKKILGMNKYLFYGVTVVAVAGIGYFAYKKFSNNK